MISYSFCWTSSSYFWSVSCIALKFCCIFMACCILMTNRSHHHSYGLKIEADPKWFRPDQIANQKEWMFLESSTKSWSDSDSEIEIQEKKICNCYLINSKTARLVRQQEEEFIIRGNTTTLCISEETWHIYLSNFARFIDPDWWRASAKSHFALKSNLGNRALFEAFYSARRPSRTLRIPWPYCRNSN